MIVRPVDLPALRAEMVEDVGRFGAATYEQAIVEYRQGFRAAGPPAKAATVMAHAEVDRLRRAELYYVSAAMTDLALAASATMPPFSLMPEDMPGPFGFMVYEKPIFIIDYNRYAPGRGGLSPIVACSWGPLKGHSSWPEGGIWITWYADLDTVFDSSVERGIVPRAVALRARLNRGRLAIDNETQIPFSRIPPGIWVGKDFKEQDEVASQDDTHLHWMRVLITTWILMSQPVAAVDDAVFDRTARRQARRAGITDPRVRVIALRRVNHAGVTSGEQDRFHHQWVVRGHWRQQWYPGRQVHRPVWINPHVKGPDGAPMLGGERVYTWKR